MDAFVHAAHPHSPVDAGALPATVLEKAEIGEVVAVIRSADARVLIATYEPACSDRSSGDVLATKAFFLRRNANSGVVSIKAPGVELRRAGSYELAVDSTHARALWISCCRSQEAAHGIAWARMAAARQTACLSPSAAAALLSPAQARQLYISGGSAPRDDVAKQKRQAASAQRRAVQRECLCKSAACLGSGLATVCVAPGKLAMAAEGKILSTTQLLRNGIKATAGRALRERFGSSYFAGRVFVGQLHLHPSARVALEGVGNAIFSQLVFTSDDLVAMKVAAADIEAYFIDVTVERSATRKFIPNFAFAVPDDAAAAGADPSRPAFSEVTRKRRPYTAGAVVSLASAELQADPEFAAAMLEECSSANATPLKKVRFLRYSRSRFSSCSCSCSCYSCSLFQESERE